VHAVEVQMWKKCAPLWREAHSQVKSVKKPRVSRHFEVKMWKKRTVLRREAHLQVESVKD